MKCLRMIGMVVIAILMSVNYVSCKDDDDNATNELVGTTWKENNSIEWFEWTFVSASKFEGKTFYIEDEKTIEHTWKTPIEYSYDDATHTGKFQETDSEGYVTTTTFVVEGKVMHVTELEYEPGSSSPHTYTFEMIKQ